MTAESLLFWGTLLVYFLCSVAYATHVFTEGGAARRVAVALVPIGLLLHLAAIGVWCTTHPWSILRDPGMPFSLVAFVLALTQFGLNFLPRWSTLGAITLVIAFLTQFWAGVNATVGGFNGPTVPAQSALVMLRPHVGTVLLSFAAFTLAFCLALLYLAQNRMLKAKQVNGLFSRLPPLESVSTLSHWLAVVGFSMLTLGIITGLMVAPAAYGGAWFTHPRVAPPLIASTVAWLNYAVYLGLGLGLGWRGRKTTYFLIVGFVLVLVALVVSVPPRKSGVSSQAALPAARPSFR